MSPHLFTFIGSIPWLGQVARKSSRHYAEHSVVTIRSGVGAGLLWRRQHRHVNGYWLGHYEVAVQQALRRELKSGNTFFDIGAHAGFFTLVGARLIGKQGLCVAIDPLVKNVDSIRVQIKLNELSQCQTLNSAVADFTGRASMSSSLSGAATSHLGPAGSRETEREVAVTTIDQVCARFGRPDLIKLDIEGAEMRALAGAARTLRELRPTWIIELHGLACEESVQHLLAEMRYDCFDLGTRQLSPGDHETRHLLARPQRKESS